MSSTGNRTSSSDFTSTFSIPYVPEVEHSNFKSRRTLDIHTPKGPLEDNKAGYWIVFIHGGAFRDPLQDSTDILAALPYIFSSNSKSSVNYQNPSLNQPASNPNHIKNIAGIASLNYRLCSYPNHPTQPSDPSDLDRDVKWPTPFLDICDGIRWLVGITSSLAATGSINNPQRSDLDKRSEDLKGCMSSHPFILVGHSAGGTMALLAALEHSSFGAEVLSNQPPDDPSLWTNLHAIVTLSGIFSYPALHDAHPSPSMQPIYTSFITSAFGPREVDHGKGWDKADFTAMVRQGRRKLRQGVKSVVLAQSKGDGLVEWGQIEALVDAFKAAGEDGDGDGRLEILEVFGGHDEVVTEGVEITRAVEVVLGILDRDVGAG